MLFTPSLIYSNSSALNMLSLSPEVIWRRPDKLVLADLFLGIKMFKKEFSFEAINAKLSYIHFLDDAVFEQAAHTFRVSFKVFMSGMENTIFEVLYSTGSLQTSSLPLVLAQYHGVLDDEDLITLVQKDTSHTPGWTSPGPSVAKGSPASFFDVIYANFRHGKHNLKDIHKKIGVSAILADRDTYSLAAAGLITKQGRKDNCVVEATLASASDDLLNALHEKLALLGTSPRKDQIQKAVKDVVEAFGGSVEKYKVNSRRNSLKIQLPESALRSTTDNAQKVDNDEIPNIRLTKSGDTLKQEYIWFTEQQGIANVKDAIQKHKPSLMERTKTFEKLNRFQQEALRDDFYSISSDEFLSMGIGGAIIRRFAPYFEGSHHVALCKSFPNLVSIN